MKWIDAAIALDCGVHTVDEGKNIEDGATAGEELKDALAVYRECGSDIHTYPHLESWIDTTQFTGENIEDDELEWPPPKDFKITKNEPWYRDDPKKTYEWNGHLVPPARETFRRLDTDQVSLELDSN